MRAFPVSPPDASHNAPRTTHVVHFLPVRDRVRAGGGQHPTRVLHEGIAICIYGHHDRAPGDRLHQNEVVAGLDVQVILHRRGGRQGLGGTLALAATNGRERVVGAGHQGRVDDVLWCDGGEEEGVDGLASEGMIVA